jgi:CRP-like cAMP-binding protein
LSGAPSISAEGRLPRSEPESHGDELDESDGDAVAAAAWWGALSARNSVFSLVGCATNTPHTRVADDTNQFLQFLEPAEEDALLAAAAVKAYEPGEIVLNQNVALRAIFVVDEGAVRIERGQGTAEAILAVLGPGQFFGEMSFVDDAPTSARVIANVPTTLRMIDIGTLNNLTDVDPTFEARLYRSIAAIVVERLRTTSADLSLRGWL